MTTAITVSADGAPGPPGGARARPRPPPEQWRGSPPRTAGSPDRRMEVRGGYRGATASSVLLGRLRSRTNEIAITSAATSTESTTWLRPPPSLPSVSM